MQQARDKFVLFCLTRNPRTMRQHATITAARIATLWTTAVRMLVGRDSSTRQEKQASCYNRTPNSMLTTSTTTTTSDNKLIINRYIGRLHSIVSVQAEGKRYRLQARALLESPVTPDPESFFIDKTRVSNNRERERDLTVVN